MNFFRSALLAFIICPVLLCAQEQDETSNQETLFSGTVVHGGYGCAVVKVSPVREKMQLFMGGYGGWFINHTLMLGFGGYGMTSNVAGSETAPKIQNLTPDLSMGYGGFMVEYTHNSDKLLHFGGHLLLGAGGAGYSWDYSTFDPNDEDILDEKTSDAFFVGEFGVNAELNVTSFMRVGVGGSYRFASGIELQGLSNKDISGPAGNITFKFGMF